MTCRACNRSLPNCWKQHHRRNGLLIVLLCALGLSVAGCVSPRGNEAADLLADIAAVDGPSRLKQTTPEPSRATIRYRRGAGDATADLYRNSEQPRGALVVVPGLTPYGKDDPRVVALARSLARAQFLVLVPDLATTRALKVSAADSAVVGDAIEEAAQRFAGGAERSVGLAAISYAVGPALLAAAQPRAGRHLRFVVAIGGYYDIDAAIAFVTTGSYRLPGGSSRQGTPNEYGKFIFLRSNADRVADPADRARLIEIGGRRLANPTAELGDLAARLGPEGRAVYELIDNRDPDRVSELIRGLPDAIRRELRDLDLKSRDLTAIAGPVILVHGEDDAIIPSGESVRLAAALGPRAELYLIQNFAHVDAGTAGLGDSLRLWNAADRVLEERDRP
jgi:pimeloyl-ACP methyl ester carboxylesterase